MNVSHGAASRKGYCDGGGRDIIRHLDNRHYVKCAKSKKRAVNSTAQSLDGWAYCAKTILRIFHQFGPIANQHRFVAQNWSLRASWMERGPPIW
jgi:hypothetical protein